MSNAVDGDLLALCFGGMGADYGGGGAGGFGGGDFGGGDFGGGDLGGGDLGGGDLGGGDLGGGDFGGGDPGAGDFGGFGSDSGTMSDGDVNAAIDAMSPQTDWGQGPTEADVDTTGVVPFEMSPGDAFHQQVDIMQNYRDAASPAELWQTDFSNCETIATLNALSLTPEGRAFMESKVTVNDNGTYSVSLLGKDGSTQTVIVPQSALNTVAGGGDVTMQALATAVTSATGQVGNPNVGIAPGEAMVRLGLESMTNTNGPGAVMGFVNDGQQVALAGIYPYNTNEGHAYTVLGSVVDPSTGNANLILSNPFGFNHPGPLEGEGLVTFVGDATTATIPGTTPGADPGGGP